MKTSDFDYRLPPELIAQEPPAERTAARMLVLHRRDGHIEHRGVLDLPEYLRRGDALVVNDTRVFPARVYGQRADTGGRVELLLVEEVEPGHWRTLFRAAGRPRPGLRMKLAGGELSAELGERDGEAWHVRIEPAAGVMDVLTRHGTTPLPPYIRRAHGVGDIDSADRARYQTVYAAQTGAVAAPTAGLHFTPELLDKIRGMGIGVGAVTLHVGPGTFKPVKTERVDDHVMDPERYEVSPACAELVAATRLSGGRIVAVGSTTVRTLETVAREDGTLAAGSGRSALFIRPPYTFRAVDVMLTNFHLPRSTLVMMVSAFAAPGEPAAGRDLILRAYGEAVDRGYRFFSYGDCMLIT